MFSSIEENERQAVINKCYWPLLKLAEEGYPIGVELTGNTLEIIDSIDPRWIRQFKTLLTANKVELIGSGYSQLIGPLVPFEVNEWNQQLGIETYNKILGITPSIALINEMAYSSGIIEHYLNNGYSAVVMEWNNPRKHHPEWGNQYRYYSQKAINQQGEEISLLWADSIAFQKFQRYVHGEYSLEKYVAYLKSHFDENDKYFPLYSNDVEIFDFRPGRFETEASINHYSEWQRIYDLYNFLDREKWCDFVFSSEVLSGLSAEKGGNGIALESAAQPIPVKKQEKYNINRWALTGRDDLWLNTMCYRLYTKVIKLDDKKYWKKLCYFWSSDFRTHITSRRWNKMVNELLSFEKEVNALQISQEENKKITKNLNLLENSGIDIIRNGNFTTIQNTQLCLTLNKAKGCSIYGFGISKLKNPLLGTLEHGYFDDIEYGADYFSGHLTINQLGEHKITDLLKCKPKINKTDNICTVQAESITGDIKVENTIILEEDHLILTKKIHLPRREKQIIHPFHFTFIPESWDQGSLYFATHNGGKELEVFRIDNENLNHGENLSFLISAKHGLGNTKGMVIIGDKNKKLVFSSNLEKSFLIPTIFFKKMEDDKFLLRLIYSAQEIDETFRVDYRKHSIQASLRLSLSK